MGNFPCCAEATRIAASPGNVVGMFLNTKAHGLKLWGGRGPRAARRNAACIFVDALGYLLQNEGWAAQSLRMSAPPPFENLQGSVRAKQSPQL